LRPAAERSRRPGRPPPPVPGVQGGKVTAIATGCEPGRLVADAVSGKAAKLLGTDKVEVQGEKKK